MLRVVTTYCDHYLTVGSIQSAKETLAKMKYFVNINGQAKELVPFNY